MDAKDRGGGGALRCYDNEGQLGRPLTSLNWTLPCKGKEGDRKNVRLTPVVFL